MLQDSAVHVGKVSSIIVQNRSKSCQHSLDLKTVSVFLSCWCCRRPCSRPRQGCLVKATLPSCPPLPFDYVTFTKHTSSETFSFFVQSNVSAPVQSDEFEVVEKIKKKRECLCQSFLFLDRNKETNVLKKTGDLPGVFAYFSGAAKTRA